MLWLQHGISALVDRISSDTDEIDTVSIPLAIWKIVSQMSAVHTDTFSVGKATNVVPVDFGISETRFTK